MSPDIVVKQSVTIMSINFACYIKLSHQTRFSYNTTGATSGTVYHVHGFNEVRVDLYLLCNILCSIGCPFFPFFIRGL